jgi:hypothetical protein
MDVGTHDGVKPEAGIRTDHDVADHDRGVRHVGGRVDLRPAVAEGSDHPAEATPLDARQRVLYGNPGSVDRPTR